MATLDSESIVQLADLTWREAADVLTSRAVVFLPIGAIEAHGPHLPLDTDVRIARAMCVRAARCIRRAQTPAIIAPPISYGVSVVGTCFPGTTPIAQETLADQIVQIVQSLAAYGPTRWVLANAHLEPAHVETVQAAAERCRALGLLVVAPDKREARWAATLSEEFRQGARHAGSYETSIMLACAPEMVRAELLSELPPVWIDLPAQLRAGARTFAEAGSTEGYFGDPASATAEAGTLLLDALANMLITALKETEREPS